MCWEGGYFVIDAHAGLEGHGLACPWVCELMCWHQDSQRNPRASAPMRKQVPSACQTNSLVQGISNVFLATVSFVFLRCIAIFVFILHIPNHEIF